MAGEEQKVKNKKKSKGQKARKRTNLATERTKLANERTLMAYGRTSFSMIVVGLSLLEFFDRERYMWLGISLIPVGIAILIYGYVQYRKREKIIRENSQDSFQENYEE
jgi:putative membrane protein